MPGSGLGARVTAANISDTFSVFVAFLLESRGNSGNSRKKEAMGCGRGNGI